MKSHHHVFLFLPAIILILAAVLFRVYEYNRITELSKPDPLIDRGQIQIPILPDDPILGSKKAPITIVAFEDLGCAGCADQDALLSQLQERHPDQVKIVWKALSVTTVPYPTRLAHEYAYCAHDQDKFAAFKDAAFANTQNLSPDVLEIIAEQAELDADDLDSCLASGASVLYAQQNEQVGQALGIQAVPAFFIKNIQVDHPTTISGWETLLQL